MYYLSHYQMKIYKLLHRTVSNTVQLGGMITQKWYSCLTNLCPTHIESYGHYFGYLKPWSLIEPIQLIQNGVNSVVFCLFFFLILPGLFGAHAKPSIQLHKCINKASKGSSITALPLSIHLTKEAAQQRKTGMARSEFRSSGWGMKPSFREPTFLN